MREKSQVPESQDLILFQGDPLQASLQSLPRSFSTEGVRDSCCGGRKYVTKKKKQLVSPCSCYSVPFPNIDRIALPGGIKRDIAIIWGSTKVKGIS